jgi:NADPH:quinone reductase-like Zn-dependent oxidoreductase
MSLPNQHRALILSSFKDPLNLAVNLVPTPSPAPGSAVVRVLSSIIAPYQKEIFSGGRGYPIKLPITPGAGAICRVAAIGPDAVSLRVGQLVVVHIHVRGRDDPTVSILHGLLAIGCGEKLMEEEWRHGSYAEYLKAPLENIFPLDEDILINRMGYTIHDLTYITQLFVPMGGMADIDLKAGESILVAPATGSFGGAAVVMALALGAFVVAAGRNEEQLKTMKSTLGSLYGNRLACVQLIGNVLKDTQALKDASPGGKGFDAYIDFSPPQAAKSTHIKSSLLALKPNGRASLMGGITDDVSIPYSIMVFNSLQIKGKFMFERRSVQQLISMVECGILKLGIVLGVQVVGAFPLEDYEAAFSTAEQNPGYGKMVVFAP